MMEEIAPADIRKLPEGTRVRVVKPDEIIDCTVKKLEHTKRLVYRGEFGERHALTVWQRTEWKLYKE